MFIACWSPKGGSGVSVIAASLALSAARSSPNGALLVDLDGDAPAVLGASEPDGAGLTEWLAENSLSSLEELEVDLGVGLSLLPRGQGVFVANDRIDELTAFVADDPRPVVVDCGHGLARGATPAHYEVALALAARSTRSLLVTRACYLALRRVSLAPIEPSGIVLVTEPGRALGRRDVESVVGAPVVAEVVMDPMVARAVDAGLLRRRLPRPLDRALRRVA